MSNDTSDFASARASNIFSLLQNVEADRAATEQNLRSLQRHSSGPLVEEILSAENELHDLKARHRGASVELEALKAAADRLQTQCEELTKANEGVSTKITDLSTKIYQERASRLERITNVEQYIDGIRTALEKIVWSPEALERLAETLRTELPDLVQRSAYLDSCIECKKSELAEAESANSNVAKDVTFGEEEQQAILQIFREEVHRLQAVRRRLTLQKQQLKEEVDRLSRFES